MVAQLANDILALRPDAVCKTDLSFGRPTLPLVSARLLAGSATTAHATEINDQLGLWTNEAAHLTWAIAQTYHGHAVALIPELTDDLESRAALAELLHVL